MKMLRPSFTAILSGLFLAYMAHSIWSLARLYFPPSCPDDAQCIDNVLASRPALRVILLTTTKASPATDSDFTYATHLDISDVTADDFAASGGVDKTVTVQLPSSVTTQNGSLYLGLVSAPLRSASEKNYLDPSLVPRKFMAALDDPDSTLSLVPLTQYQVPAAKTFNLLGEETEEEEEEENSANSKPVVHVKSKIAVNLMADPVKLTATNIPGEIYNLIRRQEPEKTKYLPIIYVDRIAERLKDLKIVNSTDKETELDVVFQTVSWGKMRILLQFRSAFVSMKSLGFNDKDLDEVKGIFADTNMVLLLVTFIVSAVHLLIDFLAFKSEILFWHGRSNMTGLSTRTLIWRACSQTIIFLYLREEDTSLLVLIPSGIAGVIEWWKVSKAFGVSIKKGFYRKMRDDAGEKYSEQLDTEAMRYLSYILYPLLIGGAVYSLLYTPHKSWWSWTIQSAVNAVYAFGFLFMLPQLFVNYRLKSVAHLPWRAFTYKAFNTFIDDLFAFIITMPTAHRVACFRDDVVFVIYLYQRYLYPVDKNRVDLSEMIDETVSSEDLTAMKSSDLKSEKSKKEN